MQFKINVACYHRICESCIDRHYKDSGAKNCPVYGCDKILWKRDWRKQTFEDLKVEREVETRKRVEEILNRQEDEFESLRDYNDFLELREIMVMNLILNTDVNATNKKLKDYQKANNHFVDKGLKDSVSKAPKKRAQEDGVADPSGLIQGLKKIVAPTRLPDYDAFEGMDTSYDYFAIKEEYQEHWTKGASATALAGGYDYLATAEEALVTAFAGLGVFIDDEKKSNTLVAPT